MMKNERLIMALSWQEKVFQVAVWNAGGAALFSWRSRWV